MKIRFGGRSGVALTATSTLAVAISACVTTFSAVDATFLRSLPFSASDRLVIVSDRLTKVNFPDMPVAWAHYDEYRNQPALFEASAGFHPVEASISGDSGAERLPALRITPEFLPLLGVQPAIGRNFTAEEVTPGRDRVVILSHGVWVHRFGADRSVLGRSVRIDGQPYTVAGVMPAGHLFRFAPGPAPALYMPVAFEPTGVIRPPRLRVLARLRPDVTAQQAAGAMAQFARSLAPTHQLYGGPKGEGIGYSIGLTLLRDRLYGAIRLATQVFTGAVGLVLLIACANVASLLLVDWQRRSRDVAARQALGASHWQLAKDVLREAFAISGVAAAAGTVMAYWLARLLVHLGPPELADIRVDWRACMFALLAAVLTTAATALAPVLSIWRGTLTGALAGGRTMTSGRTRSRTLRLLVTAEVTMAFVLLIGSALLIRSFVALHSVDLGFRDDALQTAQISLPAEKYRDPAQCTAFFNRFRDGVAASPELRDAALASALPLMFGPGGAPVTILGRGFDPKAVPPQTAHNLAVDAAFLNSFGIRLLGGRGIQESDAAGAPRVAVINETMWRRFWRNEYPIGKQIVMGGPRPDAPWMTIVGVVTDIRTAGPANPVMPQVYSPFSQNAFPVRSMMVVARGGTPAVHRAVAAIDPDVAVHDVRTMRERLTLNTARPRFQTTILALFALFAALIAVGGIAAVVAYSVTQRTREAGVRLAVGATRAQVFGLIVRDGMAPVLAGIATGLMIAILCSDVLKGMLFQVSALDSTAYAAASFAFATAGLIGCAAAATGVTRVDPIAALRVE